MGKIKNFLVWCKKKFFLLNEKQREHVSKICHMLGLASSLPIILGLLSNTKSDDNWLAAIGIVYAIIFEILAIAALSNKEEE